MADRNRCSFWIDMARLAVGQEVIGYHPFIFVGNYQLLNGDQPTGVAATRYTSSSPSTVSPDRGNSASWQWQRPDRTADKVLHG